MDMRTRQDIRNHSRVTNSFMPEALRYNMVNAYSVLGTALRKGEFEGLFPVLSGKCMLCLVYIRPLSI